MPIRWFPKRRTEAIIRSKQEFEDSLSIHVLVADSILKTASSRGIGSITLREDPDRVLIDLPTESDWRERQENEIQLSRAKRDLAKAGLSPSEDEVNPLVWVDFAPDPSFEHSGALPRYIGIGVVRHMRYRFNLCNCDQLNRLENHAKWDGVEYRIEHLDPEGTTKLVILRTQTTS